jgi:predicted PurR-regulated permease PerM
VSRQRTPTAFEVVWQNVWVRAAVQLVALIGVGFLLWYFYLTFSFALQTALIGFIVAYVLHPLVSGMRRLRIGRGLATVIVFFFLILLIVFGTVLLTSVIAELGRFVALIPGALDALGPLLTRMSEFVLGWQERLPEFLADRFGAGVDGVNIAQEVETRVLTLFDQAAAGLVNVLQATLEQGPAFLLTGATGVVSTTLQAFLILVASAYFLYDFPRITANFKRYVPVRYRPFYEDLGAKADRAVGGYLRGQLLIALVLGIMIYLGLSLAGVPLALALSFFAALFNLVPYLGPVIGTIPAALLGLTTDTPFTTAALAVLVFVIANQLEGNFLSPFILSKSTNLHPVTVLISITAGLGAFGLVGALFAVPTVALVKVLVEEYVLRRPAYTEDRVRVFRRSGTDAVASAEALTDPSEAEAGSEVAGAVPDTASEVKRRSRVLRLRRRRKGA